MQSQPESSHSAAPGEPQPDPELWFGDGNVVIIAGAAAFCVHTAGILSRHSQVCQDRFGVPQPALPDPSDLFDGQLAVHVSDSAHDFKQLLGMLYDGAKCVVDIIISRPLILIRLSQSHCSCRFMPPDEPVQFSVLAALARLGHKYHIEWVLREATRRLQEEHLPRNIPGLARE